MLLNKIDSYEMEMFSLYFNLLQKDLSDRGEVFDPVLSYWGLSVQATEGKEGSQALVFSGCLLPQLQPVGF